MKYKSIVFPALSNANAEMAQRLAFSFGYKWIVSGLKVQLVDSLSWLEFDPNSHVISSSPRSIAVDGTSNKIVAKDATDLVNLLKNPTPAQTVLKDAVGDVEVVIYENSVVVNSTNSRNKQPSLEISKDTVKQMAGALGLFPNVKLPVIRFTYPDSQKGTPKVRLVRLVGTDESYIRGFEIPSVTSTVDGDYKNFSRNRVYGTIELVEFLTEKTVKPGINF